MAEKNRTLIHPNAISYETEGVGRPLNYFRDWRPFTLLLEDYEIVRSIDSHDVELSDFDFTTLCREMTAQSFDALSEEEQDSFANHHLKRIKSAEPSERLRLVGWGEMEGGLLRDSVTIFSVSDSRKDEDGESYERTFERMKVTIQSHEDDFPGSILVWTESLRRYGTDVGDPDEDFLIAEFHVALPKIAALVGELVKLDHKPMLALHASGLLFEAEQRLRGWPRRYAMVHGRSAPAVLVSLSYAMLPRNSKVEGASDNGRDLTPKVVDRPIKEMTEASPSNDDAARQVRGLRYAVWLLAGSIILAALIQL